MSGVKEWIFGRSKENTATTATIETPQFLEDTKWLRREVGELKQHVQVLSTRKRVSKKQRQDLLARVFSALDSAESVLKESVHE